jgi:hypothetical protein
MDNPDDAETLHQDDRPAEKDHQLDPPAAAGNGIRFDCGLFATARRSVEKPSRKFDCGHVSPPGI